MLKLSALMLVVALVAAPAPHPTKARQAGVAASYQLPAYAARDAMTVLSLQH